MPELLVAGKALALIALFIAGFVCFLLLLSRGLRAAQPAIDRLDREGESLSIGNPLWPTIESPAQARYVAKNAAIVAFAMAGLQLMSGAARLRAGSAWWLLVDVGIFAAIGFGLLRTSRIAAVAGLVFYTAGLIVAIRSLFGLGLTLAVAPFVLLTFAHAVRATFRLRRMMVATSDPRGQAAGRV